MMRGLLCLIVILFVTSCNKSSSSDHALPDFSGIYKHQGETYFKFTNRGIEYDGRTNEKDDPLNSMAIINKNTDKGNKVSISALDADAPKGQTVKTGMLITIYLGENELKKGTYPIVSDRMVRDCIDVEFKGCTIISHVGISPHRVDENGITDVEYNSENLLNSFSGELTISELYIGPKPPFGMAEGTISGSFQYEGFSNERFKLNPGSASGKFENVKVVVFENK